MIIAIGIYLVISIIIYFLVIYDDVKANTTFITRGIFLIISPIYMAWLLIKFVIFKQ